MKHQQKSIKGFKLVKLSAGLVNELDFIIGKIVKKQPYLKKVLSYEVAIKMLIGKDVIKLSKYKYLEREEKWVKK